MKMFKRVAVFFLSVMLGVGICYSSAEDVSMEDLEKRIAQLEKNYNQPNSFKVYWKNGLNMKSIDGNLQHENRRPDDDR